MGVPCMQPVNELHPKLTTINCLISGHHHTGVIGVQSCIGEALQLLLIISYFVRMEGVMRALIITAQLMHLSGAIKIFSTHLRTHSWIIMPKCCSDEITLQKTLSLA